MPVFFITDPNPVILLLATPCSPILIPLTVFKVKALLPSVIPPVITKLSEDVTVFDPNETMVAEPPNVIAPANVVCLPKFLIAP